MNQIAKSYTEMNYTGCDYMVNYSKKNSQVMRGHELIRGTPDKYIPEFVRNEKNITKLEEFMISYITQTVKHIGEGAFAWDVVNEAVTDDQDQLVIKTSQWSHIDNYICKAFKAAHAANPNAQLFYNDYKHASSSGSYREKSDKVYNMIKNLKQQGCPIHGIGFQNHIDLFYSDDDIEGVRQNIQRYAKLGLNVHFTEMEVRCNSTASNCALPNEWPWTDLLTQA